VSRREELVRLLADGAEHSGEDLARTLEVSRAAVWKHVQQLAEWGLEVQAVPGRGYRLGQPIDLLDPARVRASLPGLAADRLRDLAVELELDSTNSALVARGSVPPGLFDACLAEFQVAGRGRRGRPWIAPLGSGLCLSVSWTFPETPSQLSALSLAVGVAIIRALQGFGLRDVALKWPNDVLLAGRKLGGILIELRAEAGGPAFAVIGIGLNMRLTAAARAAIEATGLAPASLADATGALMPSRSDLAASLIGHVVAALLEFEARGFDAFAAEWAAADALSGRAARLVMGDASVDGIARGIDADGALQLEVDGGIQRFFSGDVSLRPAP
jgi:BirA family biotin operon repressor/biotin-[acetyl-CoA-carboxylase] ligase